MAPATTPVFVRALALAAPVGDARCLTGAARGVGDGTFAVASPDEGVIRVYAASCAALLHEFATIHRTVHALHYTSFSDSLITLESDVGDAEADGAATFLCVYHDWRERAMVRGYTLPLGVLDVPAHRHRADAVAVCSFTGRVAVAMGSVLNIWQCSRGFFEHVLELKVDMTQHGAYHELAYVAIHGVYVAVASATEVRVLEIHAQHAEDAAEDDNVASTAATGPAASAFPPGPAARASEVDAVPEDDPDCAYCVMDGAADPPGFETIFVPVASCGETGSELEHLHMSDRDRDSVRRRRRHQDDAPVVLGRAAVRNEQWSLAGMVRSHDLRVNRAMGYLVRDSDVRLHLRRFLPPNQPVRILRFLPETIDNQVSIEARSYTRLVVGTADQAFLYYFFSLEADATRRKMTKKVFGTGGAATTTTTVSGSRFSPGLSMEALLAQKTASADPEDESAEVGRVIMHYKFTSPPTSIAANSSFLFVATASSLQVWSIWSPCHHIAARRSLRSRTVPDPGKPQLLSVHALPRPPSGVVALDAYVIVVPHQSPAAHQAEHIYRSSFSTAQETLPNTELELRGLAPRIAPAGASDTVQIFHQSPPSAVFADIQASKAIATDIRRDLLLNLFSLYRYRADVGAAALRDDGNTVDRRARLALELEIRLYDALARDCALALADIFLLDAPTRNLLKAARFFVESRIPPMVAVDRLRQRGDRAALVTYLEGYLFGSPDHAANQPPPRVHVDDGFTRVVLEQYLKHAPDQLPRLVTASSLEWGPEDLHHAYVALSNSTTVGSPDPTPIKLAHLVLILRAELITAEEWEALLQAHPALVEDLQRRSSFVAMCAGIDEILAQDAAEDLVLLCTTHPHLLVRDDLKVASALSRGLLARSPSLLFRILTTIFDAATAQRNAVMASVLFCLRAIGTSMSESISRMTSWPAAPTGTTFGDDQCVALRFLLHVVDAFPSLRQLADMDQIDEEHSALDKIQCVVAMEVVHLTALLVSRVAGRAELPVLTALFAGDGEAAPAPALADWEGQFIDTRCLASDAATHQRAVVRHLMTRVVALVRDSGSGVSPSVLLEWYSGRGHDAEGEFTRLLVLVALPAVHRTVDGLAMLAAEDQDQDQDLELCLAYGRRYCTTRDEWRFLLETLSRTTESVADEVGVLERALHHVCWTLGPEELLQVLPDDGDLALFLPAIEASVRRLPVGAH